MIEIFFKDVVTNLNFLYIILMVVLFFFKVFKICGFESSFMLLVYFSIF